MYAVYKKKAQIIDENSKPIQVKVKIKSIVLFLKDFAVYSYLQKNALTRSRTLCTIFSRCLFYHIRQINGFVNQKVQHIDYIIFFYVFVSVLELFCHEIKFVSPLPRSPNYRRDFGFMMNIRLYQFFCTLSYLNFL